jgi:hypothetical protein
MKVAFQNLGNSLAPRVLKVVASDRKTAGMSVRDGKLVIENNQADAPQAR